MLTLQVARRIDPRKVAPVLGAVWCFFAACGLVIGRGYGTYNLQTFSLHDSDLASRVSNSSAVTAVLLLCVAGAAFALADVDRERYAGRWRITSWPFPTSTPS